VSAACLAADGHDVIGVDRAQVKVDLVNKGEAPIIEAELAGLLKSAVGEGRLRATTDAAGAVAASELSLICVGTPSQPNGSLDLSHVATVCEEIGQALKKATHYHVVVIRSTVLPGTLRGLVIPTLERASGRTLGQGFGACSNPEFLREGTAVFDFRHPPMTVIGASDDAAAAVLQRLYDALPAPIVRTDLEVAELVKYSSNAWHALKVAFANEIGTIAKRIGVDSHRVMDIFVRDTKLNVSAAYLRPGFAFGGSCLPKDVRALTFLGRSTDLDLPVLNSLLPSNDRQVDRAIDLILAQGDGPIGFLGLSFKAGTDDLRESPVVAVIERLLGKGREVLVYDRSVRLAALVGANREYIERHVPHIARLMVDSPDAVMQGAAIIVIANSDPSFRDALGTAGAKHRVVDLVRVGEGIGRPKAYSGIAW
jgi:GDP-mannose 6-dehydrogenase